jgi:AcrR family transcriptional regulator
MAQRAERIATARAHQHRDLPQTQSRRDAITQLRRQGILAAARKLLTAQDQAAGQPSLRTIAAAAGYSAPALYAYFHGREAIFGALFSEELIPLGRAVRAALAEASPGMALIESARIEGGAVAIYRYALEHWGIVRLGLAFETADAEQNHTIRAATGRLIGALAPLANALQATAGIEAEEANRRTLALFAASLGAAGLDAAGRLKALGLTGGVLGESLVRSTAQAFCRKA